METGIELKHVTPYLPYKLMWVNTEAPEYTFPMHSVNTGGYVTLWDDDAGLEDVFLNEESHLKPLLYPLSMLTKEIQHKAETVVLIDVFFIRFGAGVSDSAKELWKADFADNIKYTAYEALSHGVIELLSEYHFDYQGLIDQNLALDKSTLKQ